MGGAEASLVRLNKPTRLAATQPANKLLVFTHITNVSLTAGLPDTDYQILSVTHSLTLQLYSFPSPLCTFMNKSNVTFLLVSAVK